MIEPKYSYQKYQKFKYDNWEKITKEDLYLICKLVSDFVFLIGERYTIMNLSNARYIINHINEFDDEKINWTKRINSLLISWELICKKLKSNMNLLITCLNEQKTTYITKTKFDDWLKNSKKHTQLTPIEYEELFRRALELKNFYIIFNSDINKNEYCSLGSLNFLLNLNCLFYFLNYFKSISFSLNSFNFSFINFTLPSLFH